MFRGTFRGKCPKKKHDDVPSWGEIRDADEDVAPELCAEGLGEAQGGADAGKVPQKAEKHEIGARQRPGSGR